VKSLDRIVDSYSRNFAAKLKQAWQSSVPSWVPHETTDIWYTAVAQLKQEDLHQGEATYKKATEIYDSLLKKLSEYATHEDGEHDDDEDEEDQSKNSYIGPTTIPGPTPPKDAAVEAVQEAMKSQITV